jgi:hypothetical protein
MTSERTAETEALYAQGLALLRAAQWSEAVQVLGALQEHSGAYPELDTLIAHALLKIEIERTQMPEGAPVPPPSRHRLWLIGAALFTLLLAGGGLLFAMRPATPPPPTLAMAAVPPITPTTTAQPSATPQPSATAQPSATPQPSATAQPSATPQPTIAARPGTIAVRMAEGQSLTRVTGNIEIILDASGSMLAEINGRRKIDIAHESLNALADKLPDTTNVALRTYGHRRAQDCDDVELVTPLGRLDRAGLISRINTINPAPNSRTPIGLSLQQVVADLKDAQGDTLVVLVSDGDETCGGDPAQVAAQIHADNPRLAISVIGFNVGPEDWRARLSAIAQNGGGSYFDAADATQLVAALQQAVTLTYRVLDDQGAEVYRGALGSSATLPAGHYSIVISGAAPLTVGDLVVGDGKSTMIELRELDGALKATVVP